jgi:homocysteine S-methyltransferase
VVVLDGGLATELERRGLVLDRRTWSAGALRSAPALIRAVHADYLRAGADVITTASYQADRDLALSVQLAREAVAEVGRPAKIAGSCGPWAALQADGGEYRGDDDRTVDQLVAFHLPRAEALLAAGADVLGFETLPSAREGEAVARVIARLHAPAWVSFSPSAPDDAPTLADGIAVATGFNCAGPDEILARLARLPTGPTRIAYPNRGDRWDPVARAWSGGAPVDWARFVPAAVALGCTWIGGCCRTTPDDTVSVRALLRA